MRSALVLTYAVVLLCVIESVRSNFQEFFSQGFTDLGKALHSAWVRISTAIKNPVRIRRIGRGGRKKSTKVTTISPPNIPTISLYLFSRVVRPGLVKPTIPVLTMPPFKSLVEWRKQQIPYLLNPLKRTEDNPVTTPFEIDSSAEEHATRYSDQE